AARPIGRFDHIHVLRLEIHAAEQPDRRLVIDYENFGLRHERRFPAVAAAIPGHRSTYSRATGSSKEKLDPSPSVESTQILPPIAVTSSLAMNNPSPVPAAPSRAADSAR